MAALVSSMLLVDGVAVYNTMADGAKNLLARRGTERATLPKATSPASAQMTVPSGTMAERGTTTMPSRMT